MEKGNIIPSIQKAAQERKTIIISYRDKNNKISERETEPYEIKDNAYWGFDLDSKSIKRFTLNNILGVEITENIFNPQWTVKL